MIIFMKSYILKNLLEIKNGQDHKRLIDGPYPVLGSGGVMRYASEYLYDKPSILLPRKGSLSNIQYIEQPFWTVDTLYYTVINTNLANPYYLYRYIQQLDLSNLDSGTGVPSMTFDSYYNIRVSLPTVSVQNVVSKILQKIDRKIALNWEINRNLEAMARQLYDYWFVQFDFPNKNGRPYKSSGGKMVWNEKLNQEMPEKWTVNKIDGIVDIFDSIRIPLSGTERRERQGQYPYYGATGVMDYVNDFLFDDEIILLAEDGSTSNLGGHPIVQYVWGKVWVNNHAHILLPKNRTDKVFLYFLLKNIEAKKIESGSIQKKISQTNLLNHCVLYPSEAVISKFSQIVSPLWKEWMQSHETIDALIKQRDELLPLLMNGQVSVMHSGLNCDLSHD